MARRCELTGKSPMVGNNVSHANNKSKRRFLPNLTEVSLTSESLGQTHRFRIAASALRTVDHRGGLDAFLAKAPDAELSAKALKLKREIAKAQAAELSAASRPTTARSRLVKPPGDDLGRFRVLGGCGSCHFGPWSRRGSRGW